MQRAEGFEEHGKVGAMPGHLGARDSHGPGAPRPTSLCLKIEEGEGNWGGERPVGSPAVLSHLQHSIFAFQRAISL